MNSGGRERDLINADEGFSVGVRGVVWFSIRGLFLLRYTG